MKKTKLLASLATFVLLIGMGACELPDEETSSEESGVTTETDTTVESDTGNESTTSEGTSEGGSTSESTSEGNTSENTSESGSTSESTSEPEPEPTTLSNYTLSIGITYNGQLEAVPEYATAYIMGDWDTWTNWVALTPSSGRYEYTFETIDVDTYQYQLVLAYNDQEPGWTYRITQDGADASFTVKGSDGDSYKNEVTVTASKALSEIIPDPNAAISDVTLTIDITYNGTSQGVLDYGTLWIQGGWDSWASWVACTAVDDKYVATFDSLSPIEYEFVGVIYYTGEDLPDSATLWDYKVNGTTNAKFTVDSNAVSTTLVATKALFDILPEKVEVDSFPYTVGETYWFGYEYSSKLYSFTGAIKSTYYGGVDTDTNGAVSVTLGEVEGGYTLSFNDTGTKTTQYIKFTGNVESKSLSFSFTSDEFVWEYNATYDTFVAQDSNGTYVFIGNYYGSSTYDELRVSSVGYLDGTEQSSNTQYPAHLYAQDTPTALTITGGRESLYVGNTVKLGIEVANRANHDVTWSSSDATSISVDAYGTIEALALAESVTITATSIKDENVTASINIAVVEATQEEVKLCSYDFSKKTDTTNSVRSTDQMMTIFSESFAAGEVTSNIVTAVTNADTIYAQAGGSEGNNSNLQLSTACIKFGKGSTKGELAFTVSNTITKIELQAAGWSGSQPLTINGVQQSITQSAKAVESVDALTTYTYEIEESTAIDMVTSERVLLFNMTFYGYL